MALGAADARDPVDMEHQLPRAPPPPSSPPRADSLHPLLSRDLTTPAVSAGDDATTSPRARLGGMSILWFNLATDRDDPVLGFASAWLEAVARRVGRVQVITMRAGRTDLPGNVTVSSVGAERGLSEPRRVARFYRLLAKAVRRERPDACLSHMIPEFTVLAAPILRPLHVPILTWYAHPSVTVRLRLAHHLSSGMLASAPQSYRYRHDKLRALGQGIDTGLFQPGDDARPASPRLLSVGRLSPVKATHVLVEATARLRAGGLDASLTLVGDSPDRDRAYDRRLRARVRELDVVGHVDFVGGQPNPATADWHRRSWAHVNGSPAEHSLDKAVLEAMACARPSFTSIASYRDVMGPWAEDLVYEPGDAAGLADRIARLWAAPSERVEAMGADLRRRVLAGHCLDRLADRLVAELGRVAAR